MRGSDIVCWENVLRYYGDNPEVVAQYRRIMKSGKCPFCEPNITNELVVKTEYWNVVKNQFPYPNSEVHLLILPRRHIYTPLMLPPAESEEINYAIRCAAEKIPVINDGYDLGLRVKKNGGITLRHLHLHLIVAKVENGVFLPVRFMMG